MILGYSPSAVKSDRKIGSWLRSDVHRRPKRALFTFSLPGYVTVT
jgi:hypothetical protein